MEWLAPEELRDALLGDSEEEFRERAARDGRARAVRWYRSQVVRSVAPGLAHKLRATAEGFGRAGPEGEGVRMWTKDLKLAVRVLARRPGFTATVILTLALGVGATTGLFGVFRGVFLKPLPLPDSDELVFVMQTASFGCCGPASGPDYQDWVARERSFDGMATMSPGPVTLTGLQEPERVYAVEVTGSAFDLLDVPPLHGRALAEVDEVDGGVVVLSHRLWNRLFGSRPDAVGTALEVDGVPMTIVGVMPPDFDVPSPWSVTQRHLLYLPMPRGKLESNRGNHSYPVVARISDNTTIEGAQSDMDRIMRELAVEYPETNGNRGARVFPAHAYIFGRAGDQLRLILGAAAIVLLVACGNVAGLLLARAAGREGELAVRAALGASRRAMVRLLFSESLILAGVGGLLGIGVARVAIDLFKSLLPPTMPRIDEIQMDGASLAFALGASVFTALLFGMLPALLASRTDVASSVREGGRGTISPRKERARDYFIVGQIALGLVLANGAGLLVRSYAELRGQEYGFDTDGVVAMALNVSGPRYGETSARLRYFDAVTQRVTAVPGVRGAGLVSRLPLGGGTNGNVQIEGREPRSSQDEGPLVEVVSLRGGYLDAMGIPLLQGRDLVADDSIPDAIGVLVNQAMVDEVWPDEDPIGRRFSFGDASQWLTVVGVVGNTRQWGPERDVLAQTYLPYARGWSSSMYLAVSIDGDPAAVLPQVRRELLEIDPTNPPADVRGMDERLRQSFSQRRFYTTLIGIFALAALFLAAAGIYGTVSYFVTTRTREMGIRIALGAGGSGVVGLVLRRGLRLAFWGVAVGLLGVWGSVSIAESLVYGVSAVDPQTLGLGCAVLAGVAILASALPALRAVNVPPVLALRSD